MQRGFGMPRRRPDGALESDVLKVLWQADRPLQPGEINERLDSGLAYTSVATVLTRLQAKGLVARSPAGRGYAYEAVVDESELAVRRMSELLASSSDRNLVLSRFIDGLSARDAKAVRSMLGKASK
jgi:predicted transcriptional regulator